MGEAEKIVKFRKRKQINVGIIIFLIIFVYIIINIYLYYSKKHISIYEVQAGYNADDNYITGLVLRDEEVIKSDQAGYVSYCQKEGARVGKNTSVYAIDETQDILNITENEDKDLELPKESMQEIVRVVGDFQKSFSGNEFSKVYSFKEDVGSAALELLNVSMINQSRLISEDTGLPSTYQLLNTNKSGIVSYYIDSFENIKPENVTKEMFKEEDYKRKSLRTDKMIKNGTPVYKLIASDNWSLILPITEKIYNKLSDKKSIEFTIVKNDFTTSGKLSLIQNGSDYYARIDMDKDMSEYIHDRYLKIELLISSAEGLKIPKTSIVEKQFFVVPLSYFTTGGDSDKMGLTREEYDKNGKVTYTFTPADIYYQDENDTYAYVDANLFKAGSYIHSPGGEDRYQLTKTDTLTGVYNVNYGYAVFKRIEILYENSEYCIVKDDTKYGLSLYDHIALEGSTAVEQAIIY